MFPNSMKMFETENNSVLAVNDVSFQIPHGSFVGIMGASGSGKTTLLNLIATIDKPTNGMIRISGQNIVDIPDEATAEFRRRHLGSTIGFSIYGFWYFREPLHEMKHCGFLYGKSMLYTFLFFCRKFILFIPYLLHQSLC